MRDDSQRLSASLNRRKIPILVKLPYSVFVFVLVPYYWKTYGPANFLWICDVALLVTLAALWLENRFLASMQAVAVLGPQMLWVIDFLARLTTGSHVIGQTEYMFDMSIPLFVRGLSSFHGWLPFVLLWMVYRLGYDRRAWVAQSVLTSVLLLVCFFVTDPPPAPPGNSNAAVNVNWVFGPGRMQQQQWMPPGLYLALLMVFCPACIYLPTHLVLRRVFDQSMASPADTTS